MAAITFPSIDPVAFHIGPHAVRWYGLAYLLSFFLAYLVLRRMVGAGTLRIPIRSLGGLLGFLAIGVIVGGRAGWWVFYHRNAFIAESWYEPMAVWHGGMSMHGGLVGTWIAVCVWSRMRHVAFGNVADCLVLVAPIGVFCVRTANFVNAELIGRVSNVAWAVVFPGELCPRHPSQLYEAVLAGPILLGCLWVTRRWVRMHEGRTAAIFLMLYAGLRFGLEFTRNPDGHLGFIALEWVTMGQILSLGTMGLGVCLWLWPMKRRPEVWHPREPAVRSDSLLPGSP